MKLNKSGIGFIGCGKMAQAIINGVVSSKMRDKFDIGAYDVDPAILSANCKKFGIKKEMSNLDIINKYRVIILAVKPQSLALVLEEIKGAVLPGHLIISIVAGVSVKKIQVLLGLKCPVVRVMPNTPALIGQAAAGYAFSKEVKPADKKIAQGILATFCKVMVNVQETEINKVTALSGSGPAYVFYFAEAMLEAARLMKFDTIKAKSLIAQTFIGAAELMIKSEDGPDVLRQNVTSKGGTTASALDVMNSNGLKESFIKAVIAAKERADELGK